MEEQPENIEFSELQNRMLLALKKSLGVVMTACRKIGIVRETHFKWKRTNEAYRKAVEDIEEESLDFAESQLFKLMKGDKENKIQPCKTSVIFYLKTKGKSRGYVETKEIGGINGDAIKIEVDFKNATKEDLEKLADE